MSNLPPIVCDTGSRWGLLGWDTTYDEVSFPSMIKCGLCTSETPSAQLPAAVARRTLGYDHPPTPSSSSPQNRRTVLRCWGEWRWGELQHHQHHYSEAAVEPLSESSAQEGGDVAGPSALSLLGFHGLPRLNFGRLRGLGCSWSIWG